MPDSPLFLSRSQITGASSGLGLATAHALAARGGSVHLVCRGAEKGHAVTAEISASGGDAQLHLCDLGDLSSVRAFADAWRAAKRPLAALVNNAGTMVHERKASADGLETNFATNTLGTFVLTELLRPSLTPTGRVILVSSGGMYNAPLESDDLEGGDITKGEAIDGTVQYARDKRRQIALTEHWARRHKGDGTFWASMHPGWADTPGVRKSMPAFYNAMKKQMRTTEMGADTIVWLAAADEVEGFSSGEFFFDRAAAPKHLWGAGTGYADGKADELAGELRKMAVEKGVVFPDDGK